LIKISTDMSMISLEELVTIVAEYLLSLGDKYQDINTKENFQKNIMDAIAMLTHIKDGMDINIKFKNIKDFEYTPETIIFDVLNIDLVHGWIAEAEEKELYQLISKYSYNQLQEKLVQFSILRQLRDNCPIERKESPPNSLANSKAVDIRVSNTSIEESKEIKPSENSTPQSPNTLTNEDKQLLYDGLLIENFLSTTASQLTYSGFFELHSKIRENQLCVFFRNNHFSTLFKHKSDGNLYILVTDIGYAKENEIIWERLSQVDNDTQFCDSEFRIVRKIDQDEEKNVTNEYEEQMRIEKQIKEQRDREVAIKLHNDQVHELNEERRTNEN